MCEHQPAAKGEARLRLGDCEALDLLSRKCESEIMGISAFLEVLFIHIKHLHPSSETVELRDSREGPEQVRKLADTLQLVKKRVN